MTHNGAIRDDIRVFDIHHLIHLISIEGVFSSHLSSSHHRSTANHIYNMSRFSGMSAMKRLQMMIAGSSEGVYLDSQCPKKPSNKVYPS